MMAESMKQSLQKRGNATRVVHRDINK
jgi:hypothetical protein